MSKYVTNEAMRTAMTLQKGYIDKGDIDNATKIEYLREGKNMLGGVLTGVEPYKYGSWSSSAEASQNPTLHKLEITEGVFSIKETGDNYIVSLEVHVEEGKTYTFSFLNLGGLYEIHIIGHNNNHLLDGAVGGRTGVTFTSVASEFVRIFIKTADKKLIYPQLELGSTHTQFVASTEELQKLIEQGDKTNATGIEALREGKNLLRWVLTGGSYDAFGWGSTAEASQNPTLHALDVTDGVFSIKEADDNYFVSPPVRVEEGKTYTFSFCYSSGGSYDIHIIGSQNNHHRNGGTGGQFGVTFTSVASEYVRIFIKTDDKKLEMPQLELGSSYTEFTASTEELKKYHDKDTREREATLLERVTELEDRMEEVVQTQLITTPPATLNAQVGYYYCIGGNGVVVDTMTIQLPAITNYENKAKNVSFFMIMGSAPAVTFVSAGTERIRYQKDFALEAERSYEVNALWNGHAWVITAVEIEPPMNIITYKATAKLAETTGYYSGGLHPNAFSGKNGQLTMTSHTFENGIGTIEFDGDITTIGLQAFFNCEGLTSITIPDSVTSIGNDVFYSCSGLTSITIPDSVTSIGNNAFYNCTGITSITIPDSVTSIGGWAFKGCSGLTSITIGSGVTSIGDFAFNGCTGLTSITIGSGVTSIGKEAFEECENLTTITSLATTAPTIDSVTFYKVKTGGTLTVPRGSTDYDVWMGTGEYYLGKYGWTKVEQ